MENDELAAFWIKASCTRAVNLIRLKGEESSRDFEADLRLVLPILIESSKAIPLIRERKPELIQSGMLASCYAILGDVYHSLNDAIAAWDMYELCKKEALRELDGEMIFVAYVRMAELAEAEADLRVALELYREAETYFQQPAKDSALVVTLQESIRRVQSLMLLRQSDS